LKELFILTILSILTLINCTKREKFVLKYEPEVYDECDFSRVYYKKNDKQRFVYCFDKEGRFDRLFDRDSSKYLLDEYEATYGIDNSFGYKYLMIKNKGKWGMLDYKTLEIVQPFVYDSISWILPWKGILDDQVGFVIKEGKYGTIDENFNIEIEPSYEYLLPHRKEGFITVKRNGKYGLIDNKNNINVPLIYDSLSYPTNYNYFIATRNKKFGLIDKMNKVIIPFVYDTLANFNYSDVLLAGLNDSFNLITFDNSPLFKKSFENLKYLRSIAHNSQDFIFSYKTDKKYGILDKDGPINAPRSDSHISYVNFSAGPNNMYYIQEKGKKGIIDQNGLVVVKPIYDNIESFSQYGNPKQKSNWLECNPNFINKAEIKLVNCSDYSYILLSDFFLKTTLGTKQDTLNIQNKKKGELLFIPMKRKKRSY